MLEHTNIIEKTMEKEMPSLNHSYVCAQLMRQLLQNGDIQPLPELTLDIGNGMTPDISVFPKEKIRPDFFDRYERQCPCLQYTVYFRRGFSLREAQVCPAPVSRTTGFPGNTASRFPGHCYP